MSSWQFFLWFKVSQFFSKKMTPRKNKLTTVSILQPILSGDPHLGNNLEANLVARSDLVREWIWLIDNNDQDALRICKKLKKKYFKKNILIEICPLARSDQNPKMFKLILGLRKVKSSITAVLDDDTVLPDFGLDTATLPLNNNSVGLVYGLPYYQSFTNIWSSLVAGFVNSQSLLTYVPYLFFNPPVTINGMFYAVRTKTLRKIGGFSGLEDQLCDDVAIANRVKKNHLQLVQSQVLHPIYTQVENGKEFFQLLKRWFIFPKISLLPELGVLQLLTLITIVLFPLFWPFVFILWLVVSGSSWVWAIIALFIQTGIDFLFLKQFLPNTGPWWWTFFARIVVPPVIIMALLSKNEIIWRGKLIQIRADNKIRIYD